MLKKISLHSNLYLELPVFGEKVKSLLFPKWSNFKTAVRPFGSVQGRVDVYDPVELKENLYFTQSGFLVFVISNIIIPDELYVPNRSFQYNFTSNSGFMVYSMDGLEKAPSKFSIIV